MSWIALGLLGGIVGVDATALAQTMVSRPFIAATLTGLLAGRPEEGVILGAILELFALVILPVGAARYPEATTATVAATAAYMFVTPVLSPAVMLLAVLFALVWERLAGVSVVLGRHFNEKYVALAALDSKRPDRELEWRHVSAIVIDFARSIVMTMTGFVLGAAVIGAIARHWSISASIAPAILSIGLSCMAGAALSLFGGLRTRKVALFIGIACGALLVVLR